LISSAIRRHHGRIETVVAIAHKRFAGHLQQDATVFEIGWHAIRLSCPSRERAQDTPIAGRRTGFRRLAGGTAQL